MHADVELLTKVGGLDGAAVDEQAEADEENGSKNTTDKNLEDETSAGVELFSVRIGAVGLGDLLEVFVIVHYGFIIA